MADIAAVFHWDLRTIEAMSIDELITWQDHAVRKSGSKQ